MKEFNNFSIMQKKNNKNLYPVIILGMHRSGTSLIARCLERIGIFLGKEKDENEESWLFLNLNEWMLRQVNASWDNPYNFLFLNKSLENEFMRVINFHLSFYFSRKTYLGAIRSFKYKNLKSINFPWGWKDPRNTFTIKIWKQIFPQAKIIHIYRHPVDVALSLQSREVRSKELKASKKRKSATNLIKELLLRGRADYQHSVRVENLDECIKLWNLYVKNAFDLEKRYTDCVLHICYEDFLFNPETNLRKIAQFLNLDLHELDIQRATFDIDPNRRFAFLNNSKAREFFFRNVKSQTLVKNLGYDKPESFLNN